MGVVYVLRSFFRAVRRMLALPETSGLVYVVVVVLAVGTVFYRIVEGWGWVDSLYFSVITLTTVGYGDFSPETVPGKLFTIFYILTGLGVLASFITALADEARAEAQTTFVGRIANRSTEANASDEPEQSSNQDNQTQSE